MFPSKDTYAGGDGFPEGPTDSAGAGAAQLITYNGPAHTGNPFSGNQDIDATLIGSKWNSLKLTYSFPTAANQYQTGYGSGTDFASNPSGFIAFNAAQQAAANYALSLIFSYTLQTFTQITETTTTHATFRFAQTSDATLLSAHAWFPANLNQAGDVWFGTSTGQPFYLTPAPGNWGQATVMHELGHAMGLKHGHQNYTNLDLRFALDPSGANARWGSQTLPANHNGQSWSLMTYASDPGDPSGNTFQGDGFNQPQTYMQDDIAALQFLYGAWFGYNSDNTVYTFSTTTGQMSINGVGQPAPTGNIIYRTIWDGDGIDTYNLSNYSTSLNINLNPGAFSNFGMQLANNRPISGGPVFAPGNIANALLYKGDVRSLIENVIGGSNNDILTGNWANNTFRGALGNDTIDGADGFDSAIFAGLRSAYTLTVLGGGSVRVSGPDGIDTLTRVERLVFDDQTVPWFPPQTVSFGAPGSVLNAFGTGGGWNSQNTYPRELADINNDGAADIVGFATNGVYVSLANGTGGFQTQQLAGGTSFWGAQTGGWSGQDAYPRLLADAHGFHLAEIVGFAQDGVYVSQGDGNGGFQTQQPAGGTSFWGAQSGGWSSQDAYTRALADVNNDQIADIVGFAMNGVYVSQGDGNGGFQTQQPAVGTSFWGAETGGWSSQDKYPRFMADVNGDGAADIVGFAQDGVYVSLANGTGGFQTQQPAVGTSFWGTQTGGWSSQNLSPRELADVNGDGCADLVGFAQNGVYASLANGTGGFQTQQSAVGVGTSFWGTQTGGWPSNDLYPRALANITNGDIRADIVGFASNGVWTSTSDLSASMMAAAEGSPSNTMTGSSAGDELQLDPSSSFAGTVAGMSGSGQDALNLTDTSFATSGGTLSATEGTPSANIALLGNYLASTFVSSGDGFGGASIVASQATEASQNTLLAQPQHA